MANRNAKPPKTKRTWIKNTSSSLKTLTKTIVSEVMPNTAVTMQSAQQLAQESRQLIMKSKSLMHQQAKSMNSTALGGQVKGYFKEAINDIKSGHFASEEAKQSALAFSDDFDMDDYDMPTDDQETFSASYGGNNLQAFSSLNSTVANSNAATISSIQNMTSTLAGVQVKTTQALTASLENMNITQSNLLNNGMSQIVQQLEISNRYNAAMIQFMNQNISPTNQSLLEALPVLTEKLAEVSSVLSELKGGGRSSSYGSSPIEDIFGSGFDLGSYKKLVKDNFANTQYGSIAMMVSSMMGGGGGLKGAAKGIVPMIAQMGLSSMLGSTKGKMGRLDDNIQKAMKAALYGLGDKRSSSNPFAQLIGSIFGIERPTFSKQIDMSKSKKDEFMGWNGIAQKTLVEIIPAYLSSMEAALTGTDKKIYDHKTGRFTSEGDLTKAFLKDQQDLLDMHFSKLSEAINNIASTNQMSNPELSKVLEKLNSTIDERLTGDKSFDNQYKNEMYETLRKSGFDINQIRDVMREVEDGIANSVEALTDLNERIATESSDAISYRQLFNEFGSKRAKNGASLQSRRLNALNRDNISAEFGFLDTSTGRGSKTIDAIVSTIDSAIAHRIYDGTNVGSVTPNKRKNASSRATNGSNGSSTGTAREGLFQRILHNNMRNQDESAAQLENETARTNGVVEEELTSGKGGPVKALQSMILSLHTNFLKPISSGIFGKDGMLRKILGVDNPDSLFNKLKTQLFDKDKGLLTPAVDWMKYKFKGKGYTGRDGTVYEDTDDNVFNNFKKGYKYGFESVMKYLVGNDYKDDAVYKDIFSHISPEAFEKRSAARKAKKESAVGFGRGQRDPRWAKYPLGRFKDGTLATMDTAGCGPTALAQIAAMLGNKDLSPLEVAQFAQMGGYLQDGGASSSLFTEGASKIGLRGKKIGFSSVMQSLQRGKKVILSGKSRRGNSLFSKDGHIVSLLGAYGKDVVVYDPDTGETQLVPMSELKSGAKNGWSYDGPMGYGKPKDTRAQENARWWSQHYDVRPKGATPKVRNPFPDTAPIIEPIIVDPVDPDAPAPNPTGKKRGRPKGSKNKPKTRMPFYNTDDVLWGTIDIKPLIDQFDNLYKTNDTIVEFKNTFEGIRMVLDAIQSDTNTLSTLYDPNSFIDYTLKLENIILGISEIPAKLEDVITAINDNAIPGFPANVDYSNKLDNIFNAIRSFPRGLNYHAKLDDIITSIQSMPGTQNPIDYTLKFDDVIKTIKGIPRTHVPTPIDYTPKFKDVVNAIHGIPRPPAPTPMPTPKDYEKKLNEIIKILGKLPTSTAASYNYTAKINDIITELKKLSSMRTPTTANYNVKLDDILKELRKLVAKPAAPAPKDYERKLDDILTEIRSLIRATTGSRPTMTVNVSLDAATKKAIEEINIAIQESMQNDSLTYGTNIASAINNIATLTAFITDDSEDTHNLKSIMRIANNNDERINTPGVDANADLSQLERRTSNREEIHEEVNRIVNNITGDNDTGLGVLAVAFTNAIDNATSLQNIKDTLLRLTEHVINTRPDMTRPTTANPTVAEALQQTLLNPEVVIGPDGTMAIPVGQSIGALLHGGNRNPNAGSSLETPIGAPAATIIVEAPPEMEEDSAPAPIKLEDHLTEAELAEVKKLSSYKKPSKKQKARLDALLQKAQLSAANSADTVTSTAAAAINEVKNATSNFVNFIFGDPSEENEIRSKLQSFTDGLKKDSTKLLTGAATGAVVGGLHGMGGGLLTSLFLPGGPITGALAGIGVTMLSKSEKFNEFLFGKMDEQTQQRQGGLISKSTSDSFKKALPFAVGGATIGLLKNVLFGGGGLPGPLGVLGNALVGGGPIGAAIIGMGLGILKNSDSFKERLFGKADEDGTRSNGILSKAYNKLTTGFTSSKGFLKGGLKGLGMGLLASATIGKMGVLGGALTVGGPIGAAVAGLGLGIASNTKRFQRLLFGTEDIDEDGNRTRNKDGLIQKMLTQLDIGVFKKIQNKMSDKMNDFGHWAAEYLVLPFRQAFGPIAQGFAVLGTKLTDTIRAGFETITDGIGKTIRTILDVALRPIKAIAKTVGNVLATFASGAAKATGMMVAAPLKLLQFATSGARRGPERDFRKAYKENRNLDEKWAYEDETGRFDGRFSRLRRAGSHLLDGLGFMNMTPEMEATTREAYGAGMKNAGTDQLGYFEARSQFNVQDKQYKAEKKRRDKFRDTETELEKWAKQDRYNQSRKWSDSLIAERSQKLKEMGIVETGVDSEEKIKQLMYQRNAWKKEYGKYGDKDPDKIEIQESADAIEARVETARYQDTVTSYLESFLETLEAAGERYGYQVYGEKEDNRAEKRYLRMKKNLRRYGIDENDLLRSDFDIRDLTTISGSEWGFYKDSEEGEKGDINSYLKKNYDIAFEKQIALGEVPDTYAGYKKWVKQGRPSDVTPYNTAYNPSGNTNPNKGKPRAEINGDPTTAETIDDVQQALENIELILANGDETLFNSDGTIDAAAANNLTQTPEEAQKLERERSKSLEESARRQQELREEAEKEAREREEAQALGQAEPIESGSDKDEKSQGKLSKLIEKIFYNKKGEKRGGIIGAIGSVIGTVGSIASFFANSTMARVVAGVGAYLFKDQILAGAKFIGEVIHEKIPAVIDYFKTDVAPAIISAIGTVGNFLVENAGKIFMFIVKQLPTMFKSAVKAAFNIGNTIREELGYKSEVTSYSADEVDLANGVTLNGQPLATYQGEYMLDENGNYMVLGKNTYVDLEGNVQSSARVDPRQLARGAFNMATNVKTANRTAKVAGAALKVPMAIMSHIPGLKTVGKAGNNLSDKLLGANITKTLGQSLVKGGENLVDIYNTSAAKKALAGAAGDAAELVAGDAFEEALIELLADSTDDIGSSIGKQASKGAAELGEKVYKNYFDKIISKLASFKTKARNYMPDRLFGKLITWLKKGFAWAFKKFGATKVGKYAGIAMKKLGGGLIKFAPVIGWALSGLDFVTGFAEAEYLFDVPSDDVDTTMRVVSAFMKMLFGLGIGPAIEILLTMIGDAKGVDYKKEMAMFVYESLMYLSGNADEIEKLKNSQTEKEIELMNFNTINQTNYTMSQYETYKKKNTSGWDKFWNKDIDFTQYAATTEQKIAAGIVTTDANGNRIKVDNPYANTSLFANRTTEEDDSLGYGRGPRRRGSGKNDVRGYGYAQTDPRWAKYPLGTFDNGEVATMDMAGCGPAALANVATKLTGKNVNPVQVGAFAKNNGMISDGGANAELFDSGAKALGLASSKIPTSSIISRLNNGDKIIVAGKSTRMNVGYGTGNSVFTPAGHIVTLEGAVGNNVLVTDPQNGMTSIKSISDIAPDLTDAWALHKSNVGYGRAEREIAKRNSDKKEPVGYGIWEKIWRLFTKADKKEEAKRIQGTIEDTTLYVNAKNDSLSDTRNIKNISEFIAHANGIDAQKATLDPSDELYYAGTYFDKPEHYIGTYIAENFRNPDDASTGTTEALTVADLLSIVDDTKHGDPSILAKSPLYAYMYNYFKNNTKYSGNKAGRYIDEDLLTEIGAYDAYSNFISSRMYNNISTYTSDRPYGIMNGIPYYYQMDDRWKDLPWRNATIGTHGDDITSMAMILTAYARANGLNNVITPDYIKSNWLDKNAGWANDSGFTNQFFSKNGFQLMKETYGEDGQPISIRTASTISDAINAMKSRQLVLMNGLQYSNSPFGGTGVINRATDTHTVVGTYANDGTFAVVDPAKSDSAHLIFDVDALSAEAYGKPILKKALIFSNSDGSGISEDVDLTSPISAQSAWSEILGANSEDVLGNITGFLGGFTNILMNAFKAIFSKNPYESIFTNVFSEDSAGLDTDTAEYENLVDENRVTWNTNNDSLFASSDTLSEEELRMTIANNILNTMVDADIPKPLEIPMLVPGDVSTSTSESSNSPAPAPAPVPAPTVGRGIGDTTKTLSTFRDYYGINAVDYLLGKYSTLPIAAGEGTSIIPGGGAISTKDDKIGDYVKQFESGDKGPAFVSSGTGDAGGRSFGTYQFATWGKEKASGNIVDFWNKYYAANWPGVTPGSNDAFITAWQTEANKDPVTFHNNEHAFISDRYYVPMRNNNKHIINPDEHSRSAQEALWSTAVQYGPNTYVVRKAFNEQNVQDADVTAFVNTLQDFKSDTVGTYFSNSSKSVQQSVKNRHNIYERNALLDIAGLQALSGTGGVNDILNSAISISDVSDVSNSTNNVLSKATSTISNNSSVGGIASLLEGFTSKISSRINSVFGMTDVDPDTATATTTTNSAASSKKTNIGLVAFAEAMVKIGAQYVWGGRCKKFTKKERDYLCDRFKDNNGHDEAYYDERFSKCANKMVCDCSGLVCGYTGNRMTAQGLYAFSNSKGLIGTLSKVPGTLVFRRNAADTAMEHVGIYVGNNKVIHAKGKARGVVKEGLTDSTWTHWGDCPGITYMTASITPSMITDAYNNLTSQMAAEGYGVGYGVGPSTMNSPAGYLANSLNGRITQGMGIQMDANGNIVRHRGTDIAALMNTPIHSPVSGKIVENKSSSVGGGYGNYVTVQDDSGKKHMLAHMSKPSGYGVGTRVNSGDVLGYVGSTGRSTGPHVHYEIRDKDNLVNPLGFGAGSDDYASSVFGTSSSHSKLNDSLYKLSSTPGGIPVGGEDDVLRLANALNGSANNSGVESRLDELIVLLSAWSKADASTKEKLLDAARSASNAATSSATGYGTASSSATSGSKSRSTSSGRGTESSSGVDGNTTNMSLRALHNLIAKSSR